MCISSGLVATLQPLSSSIIVLRPPDTLVIATQSTSEYSRISWSKSDGSVLGASGFPNSFTHFEEVHFALKTSDENLGRYVVRLVTPASILQQDPDLELYFDVILHGIIAMISCNHLLCVL